MRGTGVRRLSWRTSHVSLLGSRGGQAMTKTKNVVAALRRDVFFVWHAVIAVVFLGFVSLAVAAALLDVLSIRN